MNPLLQIIGVIGLLVPTILAAVILVVVQRGLKQVRDEVHLLRADLNRTPSEDQPSV